MTRGARFGVGFAFGAVVTGIASYLLSNMRASTVPQTIAPQVPSSSWLDVMAPALIGGVLVGSSAAISDPDCGY